LLFYLTPVLTYYLHVIKKKNVSDVDDL
jgi:hypothetical protein